MPVAQLETIYGPLVAAANNPTADQHGTGDRVGLFRDPTGWRGGTGKLELVFRDKSGGVQWRAVASGARATELVRWAQEPPGPRQRLEYYRLGPPVGDK